MVTHHITKPIQQTKITEKEKKKKETTSRTLHFNANTFMADKNQIHIKNLFQLSWIAFNFRRCVCVCKLLYTRAIYMASLVYLFGSFFLILFQLLYGSSFDERQYEHFF